eukprot:s5227_g3.t1
MVVAGACSLTRKTQKKGQGSARALPWSQRKALMILRLGAELATATAKKFLATAALVGVEARSVQSRHGWAMDFCADSDTGRAGRRADTGGLGYKCYGGHADNHFQHNHSLHYDELNYFGSFFDNRRANP